MPSPFAGMDPHIEGDSWPDFHFRFIGVTAEFLTNRLRPYYLVRAQERVYLEHDPADGASRSLGPGVAVLSPERPHWTTLIGKRTIVGAAVTAAPTIVRLPMPIREREHYLSIVWRQTMDVVAVVELLSPSNKRRGSDGRGEYLAKRELVLLSSSHLVELDLLREGERLPALQPLPPADYYAVVSRAERRPDAEVYHWPLLRRLPTIPIPLAGEDADAPLDLQEVFSTVYDRSDYDYSLDYHRRLTPPLSDSDAATAVEVLRNRL